MFQQQNKCTLTGTGGHLQVVSIEGKVEPCLQVLKVVGLGVHAGCRTVSACVKGSVSVRDTAILLTVPTACFNLHKSLAATIYGTGRQPGPGVPG